MRHEGPVFVVGFALRSAKARKHVNDRLIQQALEAGIRVVVLDELTPLEDQGPLDVVLQKIRHPGKYSTAAVGGLLLRHAAVAAAWWNTSTPDVSASSELRPSPAARTGSGGGVPRRHRGAPL